jgi:hypothetical protein
MPLIFNYFNGQPLSNILTTINRYLGKDIPVGIGSSDNRVVLIILKQISFPVVILNDAKSPGNQPTFSKNMVIISKNFSKFIL